jgi:hypothetical protein
MALDVTCYPVVTASRLPASTLTPQHLRSNLNNMPEDVVNYASPLLALPAELRNHCIGYALAQAPDAGFMCSATYHGLVLDQQYSASAQLSILLTCHQFHLDFYQLAYRSTTFILRDDCDSINGLLGRLRREQIECIERIAFVTSPTRIHELVHWFSYPFNLEDLHLQELSVVLYRSEDWHFPSQYTRDLVALLRRLQNVKKLRFVRNFAHVSGSFRTWYNRLIGLILKEDHYQRYDAPGAPNVEVTWWNWSYDYADNTFELVAQPPKPILPEAEYIEFVAPMVRRLMSDMEVEEGIGPNETVAT